jgi:predicted  nucleic acid-binding Zn-ribbon protein
VPLLDDLQQLLAVQAVDSRIDKAKAALAALDTGQSTVVAFNAAKTEAESLRAAAVKAEAERKDAEMRVATIVAKAKKNAENSEATRDAREFQNFTRESEMLARQKSEAEDKELEAMEAAEQAAAAADAAELKMNKLAARYKKIRATFKDDHARLTAEIVAMDAERAAAAKPVPAALLTKYDPIRAGRGRGVGAAPLADDSCGACHTRLNSGLVNDTRAGAAVQVCEHCGRILVPEPVA